VKASGFGYLDMVDRQFVDYSRPMENGNKTDVRWVALTNKDGVGLLAVGMPTLSVSAHHYTTEDLDRSQHTHELTRQAAIRSLRRIKHRCLEE